MNELDQDLPDEILQEQASVDEARLAKIQSLSQVVSRKRDEAVAGRNQSGIEDEWSEDADAYEGVDDANRADQKVIKPSSTSGGITRASKPDTGVRSTVFLNITRPYVDMVAARIGDMILPTDDRNWGLKSEPIPELTAIIKQRNDMLSVQMPDPTQPMPQPGQPVPPQLNAIADAAQKMLDQAKKSVEKAETQIDDWLVQSRFHAECRKVIADCARIGTGILKGPSPIRSKRRAVTQQDGVVALQIMETIIPASKRVDPWNFYPDPACGEDIHSGNYVVEHDQLTEKQLRDLRGVPGYLTEQIDKVLKEGPKARYANSTKEHERSDKDLYDVWYFYGAISKTELEAAGVDVEGQESDAIHAIVTMVNDTAIRAAQNPLDSGEFPYDVVPYQRRAGTWAGIGVARQIRTPQGMINAGSRNMMDNAALSGGPIWAIDRNLLEPIDGNWVLTPRKGFYTTQEADGKDVRQALTVFPIPSMQAELMNIIQFALKMAEDVTGMPLFLQGQSGSAPDTLGGQLLAQNNASTVLRNFARLWDDYLTEPHIQRYYEYLMMYGEDDEAKGQFTVDARGSSTLVERDIQNHAAVQVLAMATNPAFAIDPKKAAKEALKAQRLDPARYQYTEDELAKMQSQQQPPLPIMLEQIKGQNALQAIQAKGQVEMQTAQAEAAHEQQLLQQGGATPHQATAMARLEVAKIQAQSRINEASMRVNAELAYAEKQREISQDNASARLQEMQLKRDLAMLDYANKHQITLEQLKADLAKTQMQEETKRQLAQAEIALNQTEAQKDRLHDMQKHAMGIQSDHAMKKADLIKPQEPIEPAGQAEPGKSFSQ